MGNDSALACLSQTPRPLFDYFRQLFAQVTNPPIDPIREAIVMSLASYVGPQQNLLEISERQCKRLKLPHPVLSLEEFASIQRLAEFDSAWGVATIDITFAATEGAAGYQAGLDRVCEEVSAAINRGCRVAVLSDRLISESRVPLSMLAAVGAVYVKSA